jgi:purine nucleosidase
LLKFVEMPGIPCYDMDKTMKGDEKMKNVLKFQVPEKKRVRMIVNTDCKNEADDQFALAHHLMTPMFDIKGIIAAHFEVRKDVYGEGKTMLASYDEIMLMLDLMELKDQYKVYKGAAVPMKSESDPVDSEGARLIIEEAMKEDERPLFVAFLGTITDLASALLIEPKIEDRLTAIWIGGGEYPEGGREFNLMQDIHAANVVFSSKVNLWQIPKNVYKMFNVSLAELQYRVAPCGKVGEYLFRQMVELNDALGNAPWPHGETWCIGDQPTVGALLEDKDRANYTMRPAPRVDSDCHYIPQPQNRKIRVYDTMDVRLTLEDFYAKLALFYGD